jgi:hypothetical protein
MTLRINSRSRAVFAAAVLTLGWGLTYATAGLPDLPPFLPPPPNISHEPPIVITPPPPVHNPPPVSQAPEPGTLVLGLIAAGVGGVVARRRKRA